MRKRLLLRKAVGRDRIVSRHPRIGRRGHRKNPSPGARLMRRSRKITQTRRQVRAGKNSPSALNVPACARDLSAWELNLSPRLYRRKRPSTPSASMASDPPGCPPGRVISFPAFPFPVSERGSRCPRWRVRGAPAIGSSSHLFPKSFSPQKTPRQHAAGEPCRCNRMQDRIRRCAGRAGRRSRRPGS